MNQPAIISDPFCQIEGKRISEEHCCRLQTACPTDTCFGCASGYRLCARCRRALVAFPEVSFCEPCLAEALASEKRLSAASPNDPCGCAKRAVYYLQYRLCLACTVNKFAPEGFDINTAPRSCVVSRRGKLTFINLHSHLFGLAASIVAEHNGISIKLAREQLKISALEARKLLKEMEKKGFIHPPDRTHWWRSRLLDS